MNDKRSLLKLITIGIRERLANANGSHFDAGGRAIYEYEDENESNLVKLPHIFKRLVF